MNVGFSLMRDHRCGGARLKLRRAPRRWVRVHEITGDCQKCPQVGRAMFRRSMDSRQIEGRIRVRDGVAKARSPSQAFGEFTVQVPRACEPLERVAVTRRAAEVQTDAERNRQVDHDLHGLPEVKHYRVGGVACWQELGSGRRQLGGDARQVTLHG
jgi:hypothetical protein